MADVTFTFGDALSGKIIEDISMYGVDISRTMNDGSFTGTFKLDQTGKSNQDLVNATVPGRSFVVAERDNEPFWGGIVGSRTYQAQSKSVQVYARVLESYPDRRFITADFAETNEQLQVFLDLYNLMQADSNSLRVGLPTFSGTTLVSKTVSAKASEYKTYRNLIDNLADGESGFDWTIDWARQGGAYIKTLRYGYPFLGSTNAGGLNFEYPGNITNYWHTSAIGGAGTNIFGLGAGEGDTMLVSQVVHSLLLAGGMPRYDVSLSHKDITQQAVLDDITAQEATIRKIPGISVTVELAADQDPVFGSYSPGDAATLWFKDPLNPTLTTWVSRIVGWDYKPPSADSTEYAKITFEGEDLA